VSVRSCAGFAFDRQWVVVREADGKFITQRQVAWKLADTMINPCNVHFWRLHSRRKMNKSQRSGFTADAGATPRPGRRAAAAGSTGCQARECDAFRADDASLNSRQCGSPRGVMSRDEHVAYWSTAAVVITTRSRRSRSTDAGLPTAGARGPARRLSTAQGVHRVGVARSGSRRRRRRRQVVLSAPWQAGAACALRRCVHCGLCRA
jgi:hypothetical protein